MSGEAVRCPQCGGSLDVGRFAVSAKCAYCGSTIKLKVDAAGQVIPVLEQMQQDSSIVAKRAALEYLEKKVQELADHKDMLEGKMNAELHAVNDRRTGWIVVGAVGGFVFGLAADAGHWLLYPVLLGIAGLLVYLFWDEPKANRRIKNNYRDLFSEANDKIAAHRERIRVLQEEVTRLAQTV